MVEGLTVALTLLLLPVAAITPLLPAGLPESHDAWLHIFRAVQLGASLAEGDWYPRWAPDFAQGLGYPIFNFYSPLSYYLMVGLNALGLSYVAAFKALQGLIFLACGVGMYWFARDLLGTRGAILAAAAYVYAPYRFADAYVRGDVAESLALAFLPLVLWSFRNLVRDRSLGWLVIAAVLYAGLVLSHNLTAFFFTPVLLLYVAYLLLVARNWGALLLASSGVALAFALSAFYWVPALGEKGLVQIERTLVPPFFDLRNNFVALDVLLGPQPAIDARWANPEIPSTLGLHLLVLAAVSIVLSARRLAGVTAQHCILFGALLVALVFMMTPSSLPLWDSLPLVSFIQFPWRLLGIASLALAFLVGVSGVALERLEAAPWLPRAASQVGIAVLIGVVLLPTFVLLYPAERDLRYASPTVADAVAFELDSDALGTTGGEYLPIWVEEFPSPSPMRAYYEGAGSAERLNRAALPPGVKADLLSRTGRSEEYLFQCEQDTTVLYSIFYFPFWRAYVDGTEVQVSSYQPYGLITFTIPAGTHTVEVRRESTALGESATLLSQLSVGALLPRRRGSALARSKSAAAPRNGCAGDREWRLGRGGPVGVTAHPIRQDLAGRSLHGLVSDELATRRGAGGGQGHGCRVRGRNPPAGLQP
jgi:hypothetical protein